MPEQPAVKTSLEHAYDDALDRLEEAEDRIADWRKAAIISALINVGLAVLHILDWIMR